MNILPKKRWHVRTKDNVARVRRDEAEARQQEKSRAERAALAEQEARTGLLRQRASSKREEESSGGLTNFDYAVKDEELALASTSSGGHVNFFADLEEQERTFGANVEHELEKRQEKEAEERKIGLLKFLGEGSKEYTKETPWYEKAPGRLKHEKTDSRKPETDEKEKIGRRQKPVRRDESSEGGEAKKCRVDAGSVDVEKLRAERLKREREERLKSEALLRRMRGEKEVEKTNESSTSNAKYEQRYSSQFNPEFARQNKRD